MNTRPMFLRWPSRRPILDNQASELDLVIPPRCEPLPPRHEPVHQRPAREPRGFAGSVLAVALAGAAVMAALAPVQTAAAVAALMGMR